MSLYDVVGGAAFFDRLVERFYAGVAADGPLLAQYPEAPDLVGARHRLAGFLVQYWGGPTTYSEERGHPRLRMRHAPFRVDEDARDRWLRHMIAAVEASCAELPEDVAPTVRDALVGYFVPAADHLRNDGLQQFTR